MRNVAAPWVFAAIAVAACGDDGPSGPRPLVPDPAVEVGCSPGPVTRARAKVVACREELVAGRLAAGRIGDFVLENDRVRAIIRGPGEGFYLQGSGAGGIVDAAPLGGEDLVKEILPMIDLAAGAFDELVITEAGDSGPAEIVVRGPATGLDLVRAALSREPPTVIVEHHYRLATGASEIELETRVFPAPGTAAEPHELYDGLFFGGRAPAFVPGRGFDTGTGGAEIIATTGTTSSYGLVYPDTTPQLVDLAGIRLALGPSVDERGVIRWLLIGDGSIASVTERGWQHLGTALGTVSGTTAPNVDVVFRSAGAPVTIARSDATGAFHAALPIGDYLARAEAIGRDPGADVAISIAGDTTMTIPAGPSGTLAVTVRDDAGARLPVRVVLERTGESRIEWVGASGDLAVPVAPGTWRVSVSRGLEYDAFVASTVTIADGQTMSLPVTLAHVVDSSGWIALDTHLHSEMSTDSTFPLDDRLRAVAAEGVEVPVSSDHDVVVDYAPIIDELGLGAWLGSLTGEEASSLMWGHINAWPLVLDAARAGGGSARWYQRSPGEVFRDLHGDGSRIVQVNHPRFGNTSLFDAIQLDAATMVAHRDPTDLGLPAGTDLSDLGFDAVEVANALSDEDFEEVFADWLALVAAGHPAAATGSSDSHGASRFAGEARTYVYVGPGADVPATVDPRAIVDAIRARHVVVGTCAFVTAGIVTATGTSLPGDSVDVTGLPQVTLHVRVQAPAWQPLARVKVYEGTRLVRTIALDPAETATVRYDADVTVPTPTASTFWVVRVEPAGRGDPVLGDSMPAFTNPLFGHVGP